MNATGQPATNFDAVARLKQIAGEHDQSLAQFALAWILSNETITSPICGATSLKQLEENLRATEGKLSQEELAACDEVWQKLSPRPKLFYGKTKSYYMASLPKDGLR